jgi:hypothetical protein
MYVLDYTWSSKDLEVNTHIRFGLDFNSAHRPIEISTQFPETSGGRVKRSNPRT